MKKEKENYLRTQLMGAIMKPNDVIRKKAIRVQKTQIRDFTHGNIARQLITFATPLFLSNLLQVVYNMVDMIVVGNRLGQAGLSAVAVGGDVSNFLTFIAMGFSNAGQVLIAKSIGAGKSDRIGRFVGTMSGFLMLCAIVISSVALCLRGPILDVMNTPPEAYAGALSYSTICMVGLVFIYGYNIVSAILRGMGDSKPPFIFISIAAVLNLLLDLLFVWGLGWGAGGNRDQPGGQLPCLHGVSREEPGGIQTGYEAEGLYPVGQRDVGRSGQIGHADGH